MLADMVPLASHAHTLACLVRWTENQGNGNGGALFMKDGVTLTVRNSNITSNVQSNGNIGGFLVVRVTNVIMSGTSFTDNAGLHTLLLLPFPVR